MIRNGILIHAFGNGAATNPKCGRGSDSSCFRSCPSRKLPKKVEKPLGGENNRGQNKKKKKKRAETKAKVRERKRKWRQNPGMSLRNVKKEEMDQEEALREQFCFKLWNAMGNSRRCASSSFSLDIRPSEVAAWARLFQVDTPKELKSVEDLKQEKKHKATEIVWTKSSSLRGINLKLVLNWYPPSEIQKRENMRQLR